MDRLATDHAHAKEIAETIVRVKFVKQVLPVETNIIIFQLDDSITAPALVAKLKENDILAYAISPDRVRLVVHLDITADMVQKTIKVFKTL